MRESGLRARQTTVIEEVNTPPNMNPGQPILNLVQAPQMRLPLPVDCSRLRMPVCQQLGLNESL